MSNIAILTTRQLSNENTGLDIFVTGDLRGESVFENDKVEYTIVVVSNLESLQRAKLQKNTFQYSVRKTHAACLKLKAEIIYSFPDYDIPDIPEVSSKESSSDACYRQKKLTKFFDFCSRSSKIANSNILLLFLGIISLNDMDAEKGKHNGKDQHKDRRRRKSSNKKEDLHLFDDGHAPQLHEVVFEEEEQAHSSPFDFFHRGRKKKNSESDKSSRSSFSWFKNFDLEDKMGNNNNHKSTDKVTDSKPAQSKTTIEDEGVNEIENLITSYKLNDKAPKNTAERQDNGLGKTKPKGLVRKSAETNSISVSDIEQYITSNTVPETVQLDL